ncbi:MAG TPA: formylglycine-generating enzyme family protein [Steroidobacteraceae bacterium]|jgi:formylglycine-generating enzyme required for sulfatase activity|nr:formylglycine-generating enzyme family protein [Steroidobacteraceae bacterium]
MAKISNPAFVARICGVMLACTAALGFGAAPAVGEPHNLELPGKVTLDLAWIPAGSFTMGSPASESLRHADEAPQTKVTLIKGFWLGRTHVTIGQWKAVMGRDVRAQLMHVIDDNALYDLGGKRQTKRAYMNFSREKASDYLANESADLPMYFVSWDDAMEFCRRLNVLERAAGRLPAGYEYNLPTEAQWEYAARAGTTGATYAEPLDAIAWYDANSADGYRGKGFKVAAGANGGPRAVATKRPNNFGLYDMAGNVWQWCRDRYALYPGGEVTDPTGPATGTARVNRGGSFGSGAGDERSASRADNPPAEASAYRGFRLALVK